jgi:hypothetical protein
LESTGRLTNGGDAKFTGCATYFNGVLSIVCKPGPGLNEIVLTLPLQGQLGLFGGQKLTKIEPSSVGGFFADIAFANPECPLNPSVGIGGTLFLKDCVNIKASTLDHLVEVDSSSALWAISNTVEHKVTIHGSALVHLAIQDEDAAWSGLAE